MDILLILGLNLLDVLSTLGDNDDEDLQIQCDVFFEEKEDDEKEMNENNPSSVNLDDPKRLFDAIFQRVSVMSFNKLT